VFDTGAGEVNWEGVGCRLDRYMLELDVYMYESSFLNLISIKLGFRATDIKQRRKNTRVCNYPIH
jgi:hypothetical protein